MPKENSPPERPLSEDHKDQQYMFDFVRITVKPDVKDNSRFKRSLFRVCSIKNVRDRGKVGCIIEIDGADYRTKEGFDEIQQQMSAALVSA